MNFLEHVAKAHVLAPSGVPVPHSVHCESVDAVAGAFREIGPCVVKAQVPTGKRGKAGGIKLANTAEEAESVARTILAMTIDGHRVHSVLIEEQAKIAREFYAAVLNDTKNQRPLVLFSTEGGMDIEEVAASKPEALRRHLVDPDKGFDIGMARQLLAGLDLSGEG
jgi:succinyl-CoA synthetase beta subunit